MGYLLQEFLSKYGHRLGKIERRGSDGVRVQCLGHADSRPSLSIDESNGRLLFTCRAGCANIFEKVKSTLDLVPRDYDIDGRTTPWVITARHGYGTKAHVRKERYVAGKREKSMPWEASKDGGKTWESSTGGNADVGLYRGDLLVEKSPEPIFIVEGEKAVDALVDEGLIATTNPGGASESDLERYAHHFRRSTVFILPDNDTPGEHHAQAWLDAVSGTAAKAWIVRLPGLPMKGDVVDWLAAGGTGEKLLDIAKGCNPVSGYVSGVAPQWLRDQAMDVIRHGWPKGWSLGLGNDVDNLVRFHPGQFVIVTGIPSAAKSTMLETVAVSMAKRGIKSAFFPGESTALAQVISLMQKSSSSSLSGLRCIDEIEVDFSMEELDQSIFRIDPPVGQRSVDHLVDAMGYAADRHGVRLMVFDPWSTIEKSRDARMSETEFIGATLPKFVKLAQETGSCVVLVAHPRKIEQMADGNFKDPSLYDIGGSAHFFNFADVGIVMHRTWNNNRWVNTLKVGKMRNSWQGEIGIAELEFDNIAGAFKDPSKEGWR
jgi:hypothetical protein